MDPNAEGRSGRVVCVVLAGTWCRGLDGWSSSPAGVDWMRGRTWRGSRRACSCSAPGLAMFSPCIQQLASCSGNPSDRSWHTVRQMSSERSDGARKRCC